MVGDEALLSEQIGLRTDRHTGRQTDEQAIVRKRADGPDYIPRLFPLVVPPPHRSSVIVLPLSVCNPLRADIFAFHTCQYVSTYDRD